MALVALLCLPPVEPSAPEPAPNRDAVAALMPDRLEPLPPSDVRLQGYLGTRVTNNWRNRLLQVDEAELLAGFRQRPGRQAWIGEHVGKWLHAASLAWANCGDAALRAKLDRVVTELLKTQEPDGYLGTYVAEKRFGLYQGSDWDVWVHKYNLIGLLTYHRHTGRAEALAACRKIGDLLVNTFGPGKKSILAAGTHVGMAATSVLEPMALLHRATGEGRYLEFARYLVGAWDEPNGPRILASLRAEKAVNRVANSKAYEMLSNLVGLCELARVTGDRQYLEPAVTAWEDVVANHLYLTGSASQGEHFHAPHQLPNAPNANVAETCVTTTWIQLCAQLLRLTGEARYGAELERSYYNHLAAAQRPDGAQWCYFTSLEGTKPYGGSTNCCLSSGPRGMALAPLHAIMKENGGSGSGLAVNLLESGQATVEVGGRRVRVEAQSEFPQSGSLTVTLRLERPQAFPLRIRIPAWASDMVYRETDAKGEVLSSGKGLEPGREWLALPEKPREWRDGDRVQVHFGFGPRLVRGEHTNQGRAALAWGPLVLAYDERHNPGLPPAATLSLLEGDPPFRAKSVPDLPHAFEARVRGEDGQARPAIYVPFADAGRDGSRYQVWLPLAPN